MLCSQPFKWGTHIFARVYVEYRLDYASVGGYLIIASKLLEVGKSNTLLDFDRLFLFFLRKTTRDYVNRGKQRRWLVQMRVTISLWFKRRDILLYAALF